MSATREPNPKQHAVHAQGAPDPLSAYFFELESLLNRVESASTWYALLGVERTDDQEKIKASFYHLLDVMYPTYAVGKMVPAETEARIEAAFAKVSKAFASLASFSNRRQYDLALFQPPQVRERARASREPRAARLTLGVIREPVCGSQPANAPSDEIKLRTTPQAAPAFARLASATPNDNRRRCERLRLAIPVRVAGHDQKHGPWNEMAETVDVSRTGVKLRLRHRVKQGTVLFLTLPLPVKLRSHGFTEQSYNVYGLIRRIEPSKQGARSVGVEFIGQHPPAGFLEKPWAVFRPKRWGGSERRRPDRIERAEPVSIEYLDDCMQSMGREEAKTENVSRYGLRIVAIRAPAEFDFVLVGRTNSPHRGLAVVRSRYRGKDGAERLCLQLVDKEWPITS